MDDDDWPDWRFRGNLSSEVRKFLDAGIALWGPGSGKTQVVWTVEKKPSLGLSLSSGGKSIVYAQDEFAESDLMLVRNVR